MQGIPQAVQFIPGVNAVHFLAPSNWICSYCALYGRFGNKWEMQGIGHRLSFQLLLPASENLHRMIQGQGMPLSSALCSKDSLSLSFHKIKLLVRAVYRTVKAAAVFGNCLIRHSHY